MEIAKVYKETKMLLDGDKEEEWTFEVRNIQIYFFNDDKQPENRMVALHISFF